VAKKVETAIRTACLPLAIFVASIGTSGDAVEIERLIKLLAKPQPKDSANSNAEPGNAGLNLPRCTIAFG